MATVTASSLPRVTSVLAACGLAPDLSGIDPAVLERARWRGSRLHELIEADHYSYLDDMEIEPEVQPYLDAYRLFRTATSFEPIVCEVAVIEPRWQYIGHADAVGWMGSDRVLADWKSTAVLDAEYVTLQLTAYRLAWEAMHPDQPIKMLYGVQFQGSGKFRMHEIKREVWKRAESEWTAALVVFRAQERRR